MGNHTTSTMWDDLPSSDHPHRHHVSLNSLDRTVQLLKARGTATVSLGAAGLVMLICPPGPSFRGAKWRTEMVQWIATS